MPYSMLQRGPSFGVRVEYGLSLNPSGRISKGAVFYASCAGGVDLCAIPGCVQGDRSVPKRVRGHNSLDQIQGPLIRGEFLFLVIEEVGVGDIIRKVSNASSHFPGNFSRCGAALSKMPFHAAASSANSLANVTNVGKIGSMDKSIHIRSLTQSGSGFSITSGMVVPPTIKNFHSFMSIWARFIKILAHIKNENKSL